jgi:hypothetical protein
MDARRCRDYGEIFIVGGLTWVLGGCFFKLSQFFGLGLSSEDTVLFLAAAGLLVFLSLRRKLSFFSDADSWLGGIMMTILAALLTGIPIGLFALLRYLWAG